MNVLLRKNLAQEFIWEVKGRCSVTYFRNNCLIPKRQKRFLTNIIIPGSRVISAFWSVTVIRMTMTQKQNV